MTFRVTGLVEYPGGGHVTMTVLINGSVERQFVVGIESLKTEGDDLPIETKAFLRLNSAIKEAGASTKLQVRNAILNKDFQV